MWQARSGSSVPEAVTGSDATTARPAIMLSAGSRANAPEGGFWLLPGTRTLSKRLYKWFGHPYDGFCHARSARFTVSPAAPAPNGLDTLRPRTPPAHRDTCSTGVRERIFGVCWGRGGGAVASDQKSLEETETRL